MTRILQAITTALLVGHVLPAEACRVPKLSPTAVRAAQAQPPRLGFAGTVIATRDTNEKTGAAIVRIAVTKDYSGQLPSEIDVVNPGCCVCVAIGGENGAEVISIVRKGDGGAYELAY